MCPLHRGGRMFGCKRCMDGVTYLDTGETITTYQQPRYPGITDDVHPDYPLTLEAPKPPEPKPPVDPMILLADMADAVDMAQRKWRIAMWELALVFIVASVGMSVMMVGLFFIPPLFWVGLPFTIGGVGCLPSTIATVQKRYLAIWEARAEFAKAQRRGGQ
jgi:hypothetical protein